MRQISDEVISVVGAVMVAIAVKSYHQGALWRDRDTVVSEIENDVESILRSAGLID